MTCETDLRHQLRDLEEQRGRAMIEADGPALDRLLHDDLIWIHGSGRAEGKEMLTAMLERDRPYRELVISDYRVRQIGTACISTGTVEITLATPGAPPPYFNLFTNIWLLAAEHPQLVHAQSTRRPASTPR